jgi:hypothetical protein
VNERYRMMRETVETVDYTDIVTTSLLNLARGLDDEATRLLIGKLITHYLTRSDAIDDYYDKLYALEDCEALLFTWRKEVLGQLKAHRKAGGD